MLLRPGARARQRHIDQRHTRHLGGTGFGRTSVSLLNLVILIVPLMGLLGKNFPSAQFVITGVLGPQSNAHGPNEFLHVPYARQLSACVARVLHDHCNAHRS